MDNEHSDSSVFPSLSSQDASFKSLNSDQRTSSTLQYRNSYSSNEESNYSDFLSTQSISIVPSTSLNRELDGINYLASRSASSVNRNLNYSDVYDGDSYSYKLNDEYNQTSTPHHRISDSSELPGRETSTKSTPKFNNIRTPITKKSQSSALEMSSNSSIRFNPASLISLPYAYNNNTFTKIRSEDIVYPNIYKKTTNLFEYKNEKKAKRPQLGAYQTESDFNESQYMYESIEPEFKSKFTYERPVKTTNKSAYSLMMHNEYSQNPYKRRYHTVINERRRLMSLNDQNESLEGLLPIFPKKKKMVTKRIRTEDEVKSESSPEAELSDEFLFQKKGPMLPCYSLPSLNMEYKNYISEIYKCNENIENNSIKEALESLNSIITFRHKFYNTVFSGTELRDNSRHTDVTKGEINELKEIVKKEINKVTNELITLNYMKGMLKTDYETTNSEENYEQHIDYSYHFEKLKRLFKQDLYSITQGELNQENEEEEQQYSDKTFLVTSPSLTFYNGLRCLKGQCATSNYLFTKNLLTECDSASGCYLWKKEEEHEKDGSNVGKTGPWTYDRAFVYDVMNQNKKNSLKSTLQFLNDVCKIAIAEVRIPKPDWSEFTEYNCVNGYCCAKCCTCKRATDHSKLYTSNFKHTPLDDKNANFDMDTKIATIDLLKNVLGSCSCYCKCNTDGSHLFDRVINEHTHNEDVYNDSISWYDVDTSTLPVDPLTKRFLTEQIVQERFILRVKLESLPLDLKVKIPFTCRFEIDFDSKSEFEPNNNNNANNKNNNNTNNNNNNTNKPNNRSDKKSPVSKKSQKNQKKEPVNAVDDKLVKKEKNPKNSKSNGTVNGDTFQVHQEKKENKQENKAEKSTLVKDFKFINDFTLWDALELLKEEQESLHQNLVRKKNTNNPTEVFDPLEIDTSNIKTEKISLNKESFASDSKHDSYVEIALYLPYVPSNIVPWRFELVECFDLIGQSEECQGSNLNVDLLREYNVVPTSFKRVMYFLKSWIKSRNKILRNEKMAYEDYKLQWHTYLKTLEKDELDLFSWGVLPVRAMDLPDIFIPLPAGYKNNDISYPYLNEGVTSPFQVEGHGIGDLSFKKVTFSQLNNKRDKDKQETLNPGTYRQREAQIVRRKTIEEQVVPKTTETEGQTRSNTYLVPFFSNLTGPSVRWTYNLVDSLKEPMECIPDFKSMPIYRAMKCPEMNLYGLENMLVYDTRNIVSEEELLEDELNYRVSQVWSKSEVRTFVEKYLMYPKNFSKIAQFLENKKCGDCIEFYYRFKYRLKLKQRLLDLRTRSKAKFDMTKQLKRETSISNSLENILDDCVTDLVKEFMDHNRLTYSVISDYLLRSGSVDSENKYELKYTQHYEGPLSLDEDNFQTLDNIAEGYFLPIKYMSMTTRKNVAYPPNDEFEGEKTNVKKGCFIFDYKSKEEEEDPLDDTNSDLTKSMMVSINTESFFNSRQKGPKKPTLSNMEKVLYTMDDESYFPESTFYQDIKPQEFGEDELEKPEEQETDEFVKMEAGTETPTNRQPQGYEGMITRKKVLSHNKYGYESPLTFKQRGKSKVKKKPSKWTAEEKMAYYETYRTYGKDWNKLYAVMSKYGKTIDQIKNYYHKNHFKLRADLYQ